MAGGPTGDLADRTVQAQPLSARDHAADGPADRGEALPGLELDSITDGARLLLADRTCLHSWRDG